MAEKVAISVRNVTKMYRIWNTPASRFEGPLWDNAAKCFPKHSMLARRFYARAAMHFRDFYALRDVSLEVKRGESVGIIGRNGSGKSTLLQIIAGTLRPTSGEVEVEGRVAALLELGSGFNPDFTGRENVFMNASILGLSRQQTEAKFDEIASFAEIGDFIDQSVKTYSSGMVVRLAFAVQVAVEPDVLIVDEALSVGDIFFQSKCQRRMEELIDRGTSVLLVTHDPGSLLKYCRSALLLEKGKRMAYGETATVVNRYQRAAVQSGNGNSCGRTAQAKLFFHHDECFNELNAMAVPFRVGIWSRVTFNGVGGRLRLDPSDLAGVCDIAGIQVWSATGKRLWSARTPADFDRLVVGGTGRRLSHSRVLRIFSHGGDPQVYLPGDLAGPDDQLKVSVWIRQHDGLAELLSHLKA